MESIEQMIKRLCPKGVECVKLGEVGKFYGGLSGKSKNDFVDGNAKFITYMNVYCNPSLCVDVEDKVVIKEGERQNTIQYGDVLFTGSSETPDECGMSSVLTTYVEEDLYLNSFCFGYRFYDLTDINPHFLKHLFRSASLRKAIAKTANGVTRFNVSKKLFAEIEIPLPPFEVQYRIVEVLDKMTTLTAELEAELEARKQQYEYYRNKLLTFSEIGGDRQVAWKKISEIGTIYRGIAYSKKDFTDTGTPCIHYGQIYTRYGTFANKTFTCVSKELAKGKRLAKKGDLVMAVTSENMEDVGKCLAWLGEDEILVSNHACFIRHSLNPKYLAYFLQTSYFFKYKKKISKGVKVIDLDMNMFGDMIIPVPSMEEQQRIVSILDHFEALTTDLQSGLPAEIEARRQQYEYYRNKLLTFDAV